MKFDYEIEKTCYCCESHFMLLADTGDVEFCPFCGEPLEEEYDEDDQDDREGTYE